VTVIVHPGEQSPDEPPILARDEREVARSYEILVDRVMSVLAPTR
jgi:hypothetical protein